MDRSLAWRPDPPSRANSDRSSFSVPRPPAMAFVDADGLVHTDDEEEYVDGEDGIGEYDDEEEVDEEAEYTEEEEDGMVEEGRCPAHRAQNNGRNCSLYCCDRKSLSEPLVRP